MLINWNIKYPNNKITPDINNQIQTSDRKRWKGAGISEIPIKRPIPIGKKQHKSTRIAAPEIPSPKFSIVLSNITLPPIFNLIPTFILFVHLIEIF